MPRPDRNSRENIKDVYKRQVITLMIKDKSALESGIKYTSKKILQYAVVPVSYTHLDVYKRQLYE